jgi:hypothetical protein
MPSPLYVQQQSSAIFDTKLTKFKQGNALNRWLGNVEQVMSDENAELNE